MRGVGERLRLRELEAGEHDVQAHGQLVAALAVRADLHAAGDRGVGDRDLLGAGDGLQRGVEAGAVPGREELLGVRPVAGSAHLARDGEVEVDAAVGGDDAAVAACPGRDGFGGVEDVHG